MGISERIISSRVDAVSAGQRLDLWLSRRFTYHSRNEWQNLIGGGSILLNGRKSRPSRIVQNGETVSFLFHGTEPEADLNYKIEYETDSFMLVNKPGNLSCHPAGLFYRNTLWYLLSLKYGSIYIINRLDRETSGLVLACRDSKCASLFANLFSQENSITKKYIAIVHGRFEGTLSAKGFLMPDSKSAVRKKRIFRENNDNGLFDGVETAETFFSEKCSGPEYSAVEAVPATGRFHQIRATLCSLGYPLVGDKLYGPDDNIYIRLSEGTLTDEDMKKLILPRQALHAFHLSFKDPLTRKNFEYEIPLPPDISPLYNLCSGV